MAYAIMVREYGADHEVELCRVGTNPDAIALQASKKTIDVCRKGKGGREQLIVVPKYMNVRIKEV